MLYYAVVYYAILYCPTGAPRPSRGAVASGTIYIICLLLYVMYYDICIYIYIYIYDLLHYVLYARCYILCNIIY